MKDWWSHLRRHLRWWWQRRTRGFDDRTLWNLDTELYRWFAPRLRAFYEYQRSPDSFAGAPLSYFSDPASDDPAVADDAFQRWMDDLLTMVRTAEAIASEEDYREEDQDWIAAGKALLWKNLDNLWD